MSRDKQKKLAQLGADVLAAALLDLGAYDEQAESIIDRLLSSPKENAKTFKARLSGLKRRRTFVSWKESSAYARELSSILENLKASGVDSRAGAEAVASFYEADGDIFDNCDDSNGSIGDVFRFDAADLFVEYASGCDDKDWLAELVIKINKKDDYGIRDVLFERMHEFLPEDVLRATVDKLWKLAEKDPGNYSYNKWRAAIEDIAKQLKDPALLDKALRTESKTELSFADTLELARVYLKSGDIQTSLKLIEEKSPTRAFMESERDDLLLEIYKKQKNSDKLSETAWRVFRRERCASSLATLLSAIGKDKRESVISEEAKLILGTAEFDHRDAEFLCETGCINDAENYILQSTQQLNGDYYYSNLLSLAKSLLKHDRLLPASLIYRALLDSILKRAKAKNYHHGVNYLKKLDSLALKIRDWKNFQSHAEYLADLKQKHKLKSSFWSQYA